MAWNLPGFTLFSAINQRLMGRHFQGGLFAELLKPSKRKVELPKRRTLKFQELAQCSAEQALELVKSRAGGLTPAEAQAKLEQFGPNTIEQEKMPPWWLHLWHCYRDPFNLLLSTLAFVSYLTDEYRASVVISLMILLSTAIRFFQEKNSNTAVQSLKDMVRSTATVLRHQIAQDAPSPSSSLEGYRPTQSEVPIHHLVPGDVVKLSAGDLLPADVRVLAAKDLFVSQATFTGESLPVEKFAFLKGSMPDSILEMPTLCFMGTTVVSGSARALVLATGNHTYFGSLAAKVAAAGRGPTQFQQGINRVSWLLIRFMMVMTPLVFLINGFAKGHWIEAALFALSVAVGLTPEMLPMIVTTTLAKGAVALSRKKVIVKRLDAIQNFGAMDLLCTDKTGTLTQDKIALQRCTNALGEDSRTVFTMVYLNSYHQTGLKSLLDVAVLTHAQLHQDLDIGENYTKIDEIPFDFNRRRLSVVVHQKEGPHLLICKGALEEVLSICTTVRAGDAQLPLDGDILTRIRQVTRDLNTEGLRVVAVATREFPAQGRAYGIGDESQMMLVGYTAFLDPPKDSTAPAIEALRHNGVAVKVLTGDNVLVTQKVCREVGLDGGGVLVGKELDGMEDGALMEVLDTTTIFAKLTPFHKERLVRLLRQKGHVVGFMGDGINDAAALRAADIGISVDSAVDIAKEAADIILMEKSLMVLEEGVLEGRRTFANMLKYIKMTASSNFGNVFSVLVASAFLPFLPMLPLQLLVQNLLYNVTQVGIPLDNVDSELVAKPQGWNPQELTRFMLFFGPVSSLFDIATFGVLWFALGANSVALQSLFHSGWFVEGLLSQCLIVHIIRTRRIPFFQSIASPYMLTMTVVVCLVGLWLPMGPLASTFKMVALPGVYFGWLVAILLGYALLAQGMKVVYTRMYGWR